MMVSLSVSLLWLLAMFAAVVHVQDGGRTVGNGLRTGGAFVVVSAAALWFAPQPNWVAVLVAVGAFWRLIAGPLPRAGGLLGGASVGLVAALQIAGGVSPWLAVPVSGLGLVLAFLFGGRHRGGGSREGVLVAVAIATPPVGLANDILYGWHSAKMLARDGPIVDSPAVPGWAMAITALAVLAGFLRGWWVRR